MRMQEQIQTPEAAGWLSAVAAKFLPAVLGATIMVLVDMPRTKREAFARFFVALAASYLWGDMAFDAMRSTAAFAWVQPRHLAGVYGIVGACGYFVAGGAAMLLRGFKRSPMEWLAGAWKAMRP